MLKRLTRRLLFAFAPLLVLGVCVSMMAGRGSATDHVRVAARRLAASETITNENLLHNLRVINEYRARRNAPPLVLDARLNAFARAGSIELMQNHIPHQHFRDAGNNGTLFTPQSGFRGGAAENQGDPHGWAPGDINDVIDQILKMMIDEGPGGGHHDNIMNPNYTRLGVGLVLDQNGRLYFTNDFSQ